MWGIHNIMCYGDGEWEEAVRVGCGVVVKSSEMKRVKTTFLPLPPQDDLKKVSF
jgi:hypothetical protein